MAKTSSNGKAHSPETKKFKAEVNQVLDIVIHSLYTHREIFIRELVSNASDALEKMRHESLVSDAFVDRDAPLEIRIETDPEAHTFTITDTGIGMTREELEENLGTIARSGTKEFLENLKDRDGLDSEMIGKFGVGFYSAFMAADEVKVRTRSFKPQASGYEWVSNGAGEYTIDKADGLPRGTSVTVRLKDDAREYEKKETVTSVIKKYSNFVPFPIHVDGVKVNTIQAIWLKSPSEVTDDEYNEFFKFIANSVDEPLSRVHLSSDAPIQLAALLYVPATNFEQYGLMKMKPGVNIYSRKVLIQEQADKLLPDYMRFVAGVVDSADLPLNISRETLQDNTVFRKMGKFLTKRVIRHLGDVAGSDPDVYTKIWERFGIFIKEGISSDFENKKELAKLLRFHSSAEDDSKPVSFDDYVGRMKDTIGDTVKEVRESKRLTDRPAMIVNPDSSVTTTMKRVMKAAGRDYGYPGEKILEINPSHPLIVTLKKLRDGKADKGFLQTCVRQVYDNALAEAGLLDDPRHMVDRVYGIMERALETEDGKG
ncbi:MAG: molecular chaperone HtpG [Candidatus Latescibacteria bacterium]|nr:molecular chaperone HtpG [Candidatus Latescibacterota bacterium]